MLWRAQWLDRGLQGGERVRFSGVERREKPVNRDRRERAVPALIRPKYRPSPPQVRSRVPGGVGDAADEVHGLERAVAARARRARATHARVDGLGGKGRHLCECEPLRGRTLACAAEVGEAKRFDERDEDVQSALLARELRGRIALSLQGSLTVSLSQPGLPLEVAGEATAVSSELPPVAASLSPSSSPSPLARPARSAQLRGELHPRTPASAMPSASTTQSGEQRARLLEHLVHQHFGSAVGEVASILLARGALCLLYTSPSPRDS